jgi:peptidoglycan hydrolase CwlO-like protein
MEMTGHQPDPERPDLQQEYFDAGLGMNTGAAGYNFIRIQRDHDEKEAMMRRMSTSRIVMTNMIDDMIDNLNEEIELNQKEVDRLKAELENLDGDIADLQGKIDTKENTVDTLTGETEALEGQRRDTQEAIELKEEMQRQQREHENLMVRKGQLQKRLFGAVGTEERQAILKELEGVTEELEALKLEMGLTKEILDPIIERLKARGADINDLEGSLKFLDDRINENKTELERLKEELESDRLKLEGMEEERARITEEIRKKEEFIQRLEQSRDSLKSDEELRQKLENGELTQEDLWKYAPEHVKESFFEDSATVVGMGYLEKTAPDVETRQMASSFLDSLESAYTGVRDKISSVTCEIASEFDLAEVFGTNATGQTTAIASVDPDLTVTPGQTPATINRAAPAPGSAVA